MKIMSWNCRGLGSSRTVHELTKLLRKYKPQILFLIETKRKRAELEGLRNKWSFDYCLSVDCIGRAGGLALFWCEQINIEVRSYFSSHIDVKIMGDRVEDNWRFTGFYG